MLTSVFIDASIDASNSLIVALIAVSDHTSINILNNVSIYAQVGV